MAKIATFTAVRTRSKTCHLDMSFSFAWARTKRRIGAQIVIFRIELVFYTPKEVSRRRIFPIRSFPELQAKPSVAAEGFVF
jgi:hypothetical protein